MDMFNSEMGNKNHQPRNTHTHIHTTQENPYHAQSHVWTNVWTRTCHVLVALSKGRQMTKREVNHKGEKWILKFPSEVSQESRRERESVYVWVCVCMHVFKYVWMMTYWSISSSERTRNTGFSALTTPTWHGRHRGEGRSNFICIAWISTNRSKQAHVYYSPDLSFSR